MPAPRRTPLRTVSRPRDEAGSGGLRNLFVTLLTVVLVGGLAVAVPTLLPAVLRPLVGGEDPGTAGTAAAGPGSFAFAATQRGRPRVPVTWSSCDPVRVEVNLDGAPDPRTGLDHVRRAMSRINEATGLRLEYAGRSSARPRWDQGRVELGPGDLGDPDPVLVTFSDADEVPALEGRVAGLGGSVVVERGGWRRYLTGQVTLDREALAELQDRPDGDAVAAAITLHEFGHLVGLDHVEDPRELMHATTTTQRDLGPGDLRGLQALGRGRCT
ncbi:matrixin family metalloprotease [Nocardioides aurantiacus]|uniref:matrixin family metalloprotease n=1 Tax=Nocardioides aurantiacus TaxID=86796 RepID=UPI0011CD3DA0|nr:matrixin family metalloprotease [Nocardioides aurantiacus]